MRKVEVAYAPVSAARKRLSRRRPGDRTTTRLLDTLPPRRQPPPRCADPTWLPGSQVAVTPALKRWRRGGARALDGRQTAGAACVRGGIGEKRWLTAGAIPDGAHSHAERGSPPKRDLLGRTAAVSTDSVCYCGPQRRLLPLPVNRPRSLDKSGRLHIWTAESVRAKPARLSARAVVSAIPLAEPVRSARARRGRRLHQLGAAATVTPALAAPVHDRPRWRACRGSQAVGWTGRAHRLGDWSGNVQCILVPLDFRVTLAKLWRRPVVRELVLSRRCTASPPARTGHLSLDGFHCCADQEARSKSEVIS